MPCTKAFCDVWLPHAAGSIRGSGFGLRDYHTSIIISNHAAFCFIADSFLTVGGMQVAVHCYCSI